MSIHRDISGVAVVRRGIDKINSAPLWHFRCDVRPVLAVVGGNLKKPIICACPYRSLFYWRFSKCKHSVVILDRSDVVRQRAATWLLFRFVVAREITTDLCPALSVIRGFENALARGVNHIRVMRRKYERRNPLKTMVEIDGAVPRIIDRHGTNVLHFLFILIVAVDIAFVV